MSRLEFTMTQLPRHGPQWRIDVIELNCIPSCLWSQPMDGKSIGRQMCSRTRIVTLSFRAVNFTCTTVSSSWHYHGAIQPPPQSQLPSVSGFQRFRFLAAPQPPQQDAAHTPTSPSSTAAWLKEDNAKG
jgi:hypothetical protein